MYVEITKEVLKNFQEGDIVKFSVSNQNLPITGRIEMIEDECYEISTFTHNYGINSDYSYATNIAEISAAMAKELTAESKKVVMENMKNRFPKHYILVGRDLYSFYKQGISNGDIYLYEDANNNTHTMRMSVADEHVSFITSEGGNYIDFESVKEGEYFIRPMIR